MSTVDYQTHLHVGPQALYDWHTRPGALDRLIPPWSDIRVLDRTGDFCDLRAVLSIPVAGPFRRRWVARHFDCDPGRQFSDRQEAGPFRRWVHTHRFPPDGAGSLLHDHIEYQLPLGGIGTALGERFVARELDRMFHFRHARTRDDLGRHARFSDRGPLRIAVSGASGLIGGMLKPFLTTGGHTVHTLVRRAANPALNEITWDPAAGTIDADAMEGMDAVIHLSGRNVAEGRWSAALKQDLIRSRVDSTGLLARTFARLKRPPRVWLSASAIGYYGDTGDEPVTEESPAGCGFLPGLAKAWEAAALPARDAGVRVVWPRIGVVLSLRGGALQKLLTPTRLGLGGRVGSGRQYISWISADDLLGVLHHCIFDDRMSGPVNAVGPSPVRQMEFAKTLARVLRRPAVVPLPAMVVSLAFGEMGRTLLLGGSRVEPRKLTAAGFKFMHPTLEEALRWELGRP